MLNYLEMNVSGSLKSLRERALQRGIDTANLNRKEIVEKLRISYLITRKLRDLARKYEGEADVYRARAISQAAEISETTDLTNLKVKVKGIGEGVLKKVKEIVETGTLSQLAESDVKSSEASILTRVYGIGPAKAAELEAAGIRTLEDLKKSDVSLTKNQAFGLKHFTDLERRIPRDEVKRIGEIVLDLIESSGEGNVALLIGSYRRGAADSGDVDILMTNERNVNMLKEIVSELIGMKVVVHTFALGKVSFHGAYHNDKGQVGKIDIRFVPRESWATAVLHFTGSDKYNVYLRQIAIDKGLKLSEYGLFNVETGERISVSSEDEIMMMLEGRVRQPHERNEV